jgi:hypothetical protein
MSVASVVWTCVADGRLYSRVTSNASTERLMARLNALCLSELVKTVQPYFADRSKGGSGFQILWKEKVGWKDLQNLAHL